MKTTTNINYSALALFALACLAFSPQARAVCQKDCLTNANTAVGEDALLKNTIGSVNTAIGFAALFFNTTGHSNTATGGLALEHNTTGFGNTATGVDALQSNKSGFANTTNGTFSLLLNTTGSNNTVNGYQALLNNKTGNNNIALGFQAGDNLTTGNDNIDIGNDGVAGESAIIRIGTAGIQTATFIAGIREAPLAQGAAIAVGITADGQLGVKASSARFKEAIKPMDKASEAIHSLRPVTFRYKKELDPKATPQFGLVAEEVAEVDPDLVARDAAGKPYTVRYDEINAMLLNEFLKEHRKVEELKSGMAKQRADFQSALADQEKQIKGLAATLQKVSNQIELTKPAARVAMEHR